MKFAIFYKIVNCKNRVTIFRYLGYIALAFLYQLNVIEWFFKYI